MRKKVELLGITTLELSAMLVVVVGAAAGIAFSLVARRQRSLRPDRVSMQLKSETTDFEDSGDFLDYDSDPVPAVEPHEESVEPATAPSAVVSTPSVSSFQAATPEPQPIQTTSFTSDQIAAETPEKRIPTIETEAGNSLEPERQIAPISIIDESPIVPSATKEEEEAPVARSDPIAMPTDSAAIENMTPAPAFPVTPQAAPLGSIASSSAPRAGVSTPSAYCVKCKSKKLIKDPTSVTMKNGRPAVSGFCSDCGTRVFRIGKLSAF